MKMKNENKRRAGALVLVGASLLALAACGTRNEAWETGLVSSEGMSLFGLTGSVALHDERLERVVFYTVPDAKSIEARSFELGKNAGTFQMSPDRRHLFVLSSGVFPRENEDDEKPQLQVFSGESDADEPRVYEFDDPKQSLAIDPEGRWVAAFAGEATVTNPNEVVLLDLSKKNAKPVSKTIRSFGGAPVELVFTSELAVPRGDPRRFLIVRTDRDVTLIDLSNLDREEVTVKLPKDEDGVPRVPQQIVFDDGDPDDDGDARIGILLAGTSDVVLLELGEPIAEDKDFFVGVNIVDVGGVPAAIDFVRTDGGLRLAALVPSRQRATLVNPETTSTEIVDLGSAYTHMVRITQSVSETPEGGDVALLWGESQTFAFWSLGSTSGSPYRAVDATELDLDIYEVLDVPAPNQHLKVLVGSPDSSKFYVLDLKKRESFPLHTESSGFQITVSPDGGRLWAYSPGGDNFSAVRFSDLHPSQLHVNPAPTRIFDLERGDGGRAALALEDNSYGLSATLLDASNPDSAKSRYFPALHLEDIE